MYPSFGKRPVKSKVTGTGATRTSANKNERFAHTFVGVFVWTDTERYGTLHRIAHTYSVDDECR